MLESNPSAYTMAGQYLGRLPPKRRSSPQAPKKRYWPAPKRKTHLKEKPRGAHPNRCREASDYFS